MEGLKAPENVSEGSTLRLRRHVVGGDSGGRGSGIGPCDSRGTQSHRRGRVERYRQGLSGG